MSNKNLLARALAGRSRNQLEAWMPPAPGQGPAPNFLEAQMPGAPQQGPPPVFHRGLAISPEGLQNGGPPPMPAQRPTPLMMAAAAQPPPGDLPPMPPSQQIGPQGYAPGSMPPVTMGQQAPPGSMMGRNELERDYYRQLAANPNGFDAGWLGRLLG